jgi:YTH domain-containing protein 1
VAPTRFGRVGHLKNKLNENQAVLVAKDGQEVEEVCGEQLTRIIDEEAELDLTSWYREPGQTT